MCLVWGLVEKLKRQDLKYMKQLEKYREAVLCRYFMLEQVTEVLNPGL